MRICRSIQCSPSHLSHDLLLSSYHSKASDISKHYNALHLASPYSIDSSPDSINIDPAAESCLAPVDSHHFLPNTSNQSSPALSVCSSPAVIPIATSPGPSLDTHKGSAPASSTDHAPHQDDLGSVDHAKGHGQRARSPAVDVIGLNPLKKAPRGNSVKQYHELDSMQGVVFYQSLEVTDEYGTQHCFDVRDKTQGALVSRRMSSSCALAVCIADKPTSCRRCTSLLHELSRPPV